ncbi:MAG: hypothetical protein ACRC5A_13060 [Enterobacteriaceae bacterium]
MSKVSTNAGSALCDCDTPNPCVHEVKLKSGKTEQIYPIVQKPALKVYDKGKGVDVTIKISSKCNKPSCPKSILEHTEDNNRIEKKLKNNTDNEEKVYFKKEPLTDQDLLAQLGSDIWQFFADYGNIIDLFKKPKEYRVITKGCHTEDEFGIIEVYPSTKFYVEAGLSYQIQWGKRKDKERRDEQISNRKDEARKDAQIRNTQEYEKALPKDKNKWRKGWTLHTDKFYFSQGLYLSGKCKLDVQGVDYSAKLNPKLWSKYKNICRYLSS